MMRKDFYPLVEKDIFKGFSKDFLVHLNCKYKIQIVNNQIYCNKAEDQ